MRVGRPSVLSGCVVYIYSIWVESSTRLGGFRALKKTTEAPYTTKVNYRKHTTAVEPPKTTKRYARGMAPLYKRASKIRTVPRLR